MALSRSSRVFVGAVSQCFSLIFSSDYLKGIGVDEAHILKYKLDNIKLRKYRDPEVLYDDIIAKTTAPGQYYLFLDEIQFVEDFPELMTA